MRQTTKKSIVRTKKIRPNKKYVFIFILITIIILSAFLIKMAWSNPQTRWLIADLFPREDKNKLTIAPAIAVTSSFPNAVATTINDASWLDQTTVAAVYQPKTAAEVTNIILYAQKLHKQIAISGIRHSMGGQAFLRDGIVLDMTKMDSVTYNSDKTVTVGPGATWQQVQNVLDGYGRSVAVMQDSNIFTVGGSVSVNVHGKDPHYGSLIATINYLRVINPEGQEITVSRTQHPDLFKAIVGGYGLFGVITQVNLNTTEDASYQFSMKELNTKDLLNVLNANAADKTTGLMEVHLSVDRSNLFTKALLYRYSETPAPAIAPVSNTTGENNIWLRKAVFRLSETSDFGKYVRWEAEKYLTPLVEQKIVTRNTAMAVPVRFLEHTSSPTTDVLQEYFIPKDQFYNFLNYYKKVIIASNINLENVTIRKVNKDTESKLSYATDDMYAFVVYYSVDRDQDSPLSSVTNQMMTYLNSIDGKFYLCYNADYSYSQLQQMYPEVISFIQLKQHYDPQTLFSSNWYERMEKSQISPL